jgi:hypothetical protein
VVAAAQLTIAAFHVGHAAPDLRDSMFDLAKSLVKRR